MPESREMTLEEVVNALPESHSARREYDQLVDPEMLSDLHQKLFNADLALSDAKVLHEREIERLNVNEVGCDIEECEASDPINMGRVEMRIEIRRLRDVVEDLLRSSVEAAEVLQRSRFTARSSGARKQ